jgi:KaiC/GvpD/RAD55 family RecA-like ATPase
VGPFRVPTGVEGLDEMLGGGLPQGHCVLVCGGPGSGKTIFGIQFLYSGAVKCNDAGLYVSLDENPNHLKRNLAGFGWDLENLEKNGKFMIVDASPMRVVPGEIKAGQFIIGKKDFNMLGLIHIIKDRVKEIHAKRLVIDPITMLVLQYPDVSERRNAILNLFEALTELGTTNLVIAEMRTTSLERRIKAEEFLSHGVILLHNFAHNGRIISAVQIEKMRGISHDKQLRPYEISKNGIEVFPKESLIIGEENRQFSL